MLTYKGTDKDMKCHGGFQYELGKEYTDDGAIRCGYKGFHSVEAPLDAFSYFPPIDGNRFFSCVADGTIDKSDEDTKIASSELTLKTEIGILGLIKAQIEYVLKSTKKKVAKKEKENAAAQGYRGHAAAQGDSGHAEVHGERAIASSFGIAGRVMGGKIGDLLTLYQWEIEDNEWNPISGITVRVDGEKIKPNVWYKLNGTEFVEVEEDEP